MLRNAVTVHPVAVVVAAVGQQPALDMKGFLFGGTGSCQLRQQALGLVRAAVGVGAGATANEDNVVRSWLCTTVFCSYQLF